MLITNNTQFFYNNITAVDTNGFIYGGLIFNNNTAKIYTESTSFSNNVVTAYGSNTFIYGGLIYNGKGNITFNKTNFSNNKIMVQGTNGFLYGGILYTNGTTSFTSGSINNHLTNITGAGTYLYGGLFCNQKEASLTFNNYTFYSLTSRLPEARIRGIGVIIYNDGELNMTNGSLNVNNILSEGNQINIRGATIYNNGNTSLRNTTFNQLSANANITGMIISGGIVYNDQIGNLSLINNTFYYNVIGSSDGSTQKAFTYGGVVYNYNLLTVENNTFASNSAYDGGVIYHNSTSNLTIYNNTIRDNRAFNNGGAIYTYNTNLSIIISNIYSNYAGYSGGVVYSPTLSNVTIFNSSFTTNGANSGSGGVMYVYTSNNYTMDVINSTFYSNYASNTGGHGGVFYLYNTNSNNKYNITILNSNLTSNRANSGSGGVIYKFNGYGNITVLNSNFTSNYVGSISGQGGVICYSSSYSSSNNHNNLTVFNSSFTGNHAYYRGGVIYYGSSYNFIKLNISTFNNNYVSGSYSGDYGGGVVYLSGSYSNVTLVDSTFNNSRANNGNGGVVYSTGSYNNISLLNSTFANGSSYYTGGVVYVSGSYNDLALKNSTFNNIVSTQSSGGVVSVSGSYNNATLIDSTFNNTRANNGNGGVVYYYSGSSGNSNNLSVINSNFTNSYAYNQGGVIYAQGSSATSLINVNITKSNFINNTAYYYYGGAIRSTYGTLNINDSNFTNNRVSRVSDSTYGGAVLKSYGYLNINNTNFNNNSAYQMGGAIYTDGNCNTTIINNTFNNNSVLYYGSSSNRYGGAIYSYGNDLTILNSSFTNNTVSSYGYSLGGAIYKSGGTLNINNTILENNKVNKRSSSSSNIGGGAIWLSATGILDNVSFINNSLSTSTYGSIYGGAIYDEGGYVLTILNSSFVNNTASTYYYGYGGAIYKSNGALNINNTGFENNKINRTSPTSSNNQLYGGAIYLSTTGTFNNVSFINNSLSTNNYANTYGGAIYSVNSYVLTISNSSFVNNSASPNYYGYGGAIYKSSGTLNINNTVFENNKINRTITNSNTYGIHGGAIYLATTGTFNNVSFINNSLSNAQGDTFGGAVSSLNSYVLTISNSSFVNNTVSPSYYGYGGAIYKSNGILNINNTKFENNKINKTNRTAYDLYGGAIAYISAGSYLTISNNSFVNNSIYSLASSNVYGGAIYTTSYVNITDTGFTNNSVYANGSSSIAHGGALVATGTISSSSRYIYLTNNTFTNNTAIANGSSSVSRGGAVSLNGTAMVRANNNTFINNSVIANGTYATGYGGAFYGGITYSGVITSNRITYNHNLNFTNSSFVGNKVIANGTGSVVSAGAVYANVLLDRTNYLETSGYYEYFYYYLTLNNALFDDNTAYANGSDGCSLGGAVNNLVTYTGFLAGRNNYRYYNSYITITNVTFNNNTAGVNGTNGISRGGSIYGGSVFSGSSVSGNVNSTTCYRGYVSTLTITNSSFNNSQAIVNGSNAMALGGAIYDASLSDGENITRSLLRYNVTINNTNITNNVANVSDANGLSYAGAVFSAGNMTISNTKVNNNTAGYAGAVYVNGNLTVVNDTFMDNNATYGGVFYNNAIFNLTDNKNVFINNTAVSGGVIYNDGNLTLNNTIFNSSGNATEYGGILYNNQTAIIGNATFNNNTAGISGAAIYNAKELNMTNSTITNNKASNGAAIYNSGNGSINNTKINNNNATVYAGAVYNRGNITISNSTLNWNNASNGGLLYTTENSNTTLTTSHVENNTVTSPNSFIVYNLGTFTAQDNVFENNSNTTRDDILFLHDDAGLNANTYASGNTYNNNSLVTNTTIVEPIETETGIIFNVTTNIYPVYNGTVKEGNITLFVNGVEKGNYTLKDSLTTIELSYDELQEDSNLLKTDYASYDLSYQPSDDNITVTKINSKVVIDNEDLVKVNTETIVNITVLDNVNRPIPNSKVNISVNGNKLEGDYTTDSQGRVVITLDNSTLVVGENNISASYDGSRLYYGSNNTSVLTVDKLEQVINATVINRYVGNTTIEVSTYDNITGEKIPNVNVSVTLENGTVVKGMTNENGSINLTIPTVKAGEITVTLNANSTDVYKSQTNTTVIDVIKRPTDISNIVLVNITTKNGIAVVTILDETNGGNVLNGTVIIKENDTILGQEDIVGGSADIKVLFDLSPGLHDIQVEYLGDDWYINSSGLKTVYVEKLYAVITADNFEDYVFNPVEITADIKDSRGNIITNGTVNVEVENTTLTATIENGVIKFNHTFSTAGSHKVVINYDGGDSYQSATGIVNVTISKRNTYTNAEIKNNTFNVEVYDTENKLVTGNGTVIIKENDEVIGTGVVNGGKVNITATVLPGEHNVVVEYLGDDNYNGSSTTVEWSTSKLDTTITLNEYETIVNKTVTITGTIIGNDSNAINGRANITIEGINHTINVVNGLFSYNYTPQTSGDKEVTVRYLGDDTYNPSTKITTVAVDTIDTVITINNTSQLKANQTSEINITLKDANGNTLSDTSVTLVIDGTEYPLTTDSNGIARYNYTPQTSGIKSITANYKGSTVYSSSTNASTITVDKINSTMMVISTSESNVNQTTTINITLKDENGNPISGKVLNLTVGNVSVNVVTGTDGIARYDYTPQTDGEKVIIARYDGDEIFATSTNTSTITVNKVNTNIAISDLTQVDVNESTTINITLTDNEGNPLTNKTINLTIDGQTVPVTTNGSGVANYTYTPQTEGTKYITATYNGDNIYVSSTNNTNLAVNKVQTDITITAVDQMKVNNQTVLNITLKDSNGNVLSNKTVNLIIDGQIYSGTTNGSGVANYTYTPQTGGSKNILVAYNGDNIYSSSTDTHLITVNKTLTTLTIDPLDQAKINQKTEINVTLTDEYGNKLSNQKVNLTVGDQSVLLTTDSNGIVRYNYTADIETIVNVVAIYGETDVYQYSITADPFTVNKINATISNIVMANTTVGNSSINITLIDEYSNVLPNAQVIIKNESGSVIASGYTNDEGIANIPLDLTGGTYPITIEYAGNQTYTSTSNTTTIGIGKLPTILTLDKGGDRVGNTTIYGKLVDETTGRAIAYSDVTLYHADTGETIGTFTTNASGMIEVPIFLLKGNHTFTAGYNGSNVYESTNATLKYEVLRVPTKTTRNITHRFIDDFTLNVTVTHDSSESSDIIIRNGTVKAYINGTDTPVATGELVDGSVILHPDIDTPGVYDITIQYEGNDYYQPSSTVIEDYTLDRAPTAITPQREGEYVGNTSVTATLKDNENNKLLSNATIKVYVDEINVANVTTDEAGTINLKLNLSEGDHTVNFVYEGNGTYRGSNNTIGYPVVKIPVVFNQTRATNTSLENSTILVEVLDDRTKTPVLNGTIVIYDTDEEIKEIGRATLVESDNGTVEIKTDVELEEGIHHLLIVYEGNDYYQSRNTTLVFETDKISTHIKADKVGHYVGNNSLNVTLTDVSGNIIPNAVVKVLNSTSGKIIATGHTDDEGVTLIDLGLPAGSHPLEIVYEGNDTYTPTSVNTTYVVEKIPTKTTRNVTYRFIGNFTINATVLTDITGEDSTPVQNGTVIILLNNTKQEVGRGEVVNGSVLITPTFQELGNHSFIIQYMGNDYYINSSTVLENVEIVTIPTALTPIKIGDRVGNTTLTVNIKEHTLTPQDEVLPNSQINVYENNELIATGITDENGNVTFKLNLTAGSHNLKIEYSGNDTHRGVINEILYDVLKKPTSIVEIETINNTVGNATIKVKINDTTHPASPVPVENGTIQIVLPDGTIVGEGEVENGETIIKTNITESGSYNLTIIYKENDYYYATSTTQPDIQFADRTQTINVTILNTTVGNTTININLTDSETGKQLPNMPINVTLPDGTIIETTTNNEGLVNVTIPTETRGITTVEITSIGNTTYAQATNITDINVTKRPTITTAAVLTTTALNNTVKVLVVDAYSNTNVFKGDVELYCDGVKVGNSSLVNGEAVVLTTLGSKGLYNVTVLYIENDYYYASNTTVGVTVTGRTQNVTGRVVNDTIGNTTVEVVVVDNETGVPLDNMPVNVTLPNGTVVNGTTNENGTVIITIPTVNNETLPLNITTPETNVYDNGTGNVNVTPQKRDSQVSYEVVDDKVGETTLDITVTDKVTGDVVPNGTVVIKDEDDDVIGIGTVEDGKTTIVLDTLPAGDNLIVIEYQGNEVYNPSENDTVIPVVKKDVVITPTIVNETIGNTTIEVNVTDGNSTPIPNMPVNVTLPDGTVVNGTTNENGTVIITVPTVNNETLPLDITTPETDEYNNGTNTTNINPEKRPSTVTPIVIDNTIGETKLDVTVTDVTTGDLVPNGTVVVKDSEGNPVGNGTVVNGKVVIDVDLPAGNHTVTVEYGGNEVYYPSAANTTIEILKKDVVINATVVNDTIGNTTIEVNVTDGNGTPIPNMPVNVTLPNGTVVNGTTDENGTVNITIPTISTDPIDVNVTTPETPEYNNGTNTTEVTPEKRPSMVSPEVIDNIVGETKLDVTVTDVTTGDLVPNGTVVVKDSEGNPVGNGTVVNGKVVIDVDLPAGNHTVTVEYGGNEVYYASTNITKLEILKKDVVINTMVLNDTIGNTTLEIEVSLPNGTAIPNMPVNVTLPNGTVVNGTTNENGTMIITIPTVNNETLPLDITTPETDEYNNGTNATEVTPEKRDSQVSYEIVDDKVGETTLDITVTDKVTGDFVPNGTVVIKDEDDDVIGIGTVENGKTTIVLDTLPAGDNPIVIEYQGNEVYNPSENDTIIPVVKKDVVINTTIINDTIGNTTLEVTVTENGTNNPVPNMPVNITLPNGTVVNGTTDENGTVNITIPTISTDPIDVNVTTPETPEYNNGTNTTEVTPEKRPSMVSPEVIDNTVGETKLDVTVTDKVNGDLVPNGTVVVKDSEGNPVGNGTVVNGKVIVDINLPAGNHTVTVEYGGNEVYYPSTNITKLEIIKRNVVINTTVINSTIGNTTIEINVTEGNGTPVLDMPVNVTLPNGTVVNGTTNENGTVIITIPTINNETLPINITTPENDIYNNGTANTTVTPIKRGVKVTLPDYEMYVLDYANITVNVTDEYGNPVHGGYIIFKVNGKTLQANGKFSTTGKNPMKIDVYNGKATIVFNATSFYKAGGINTMLVKYSGSSKYNQNSSSIQKLTIKKRIGYVEVTTDKTEYKLYETVNIKATYYDITHGNKTALYSDNTTYAVYKINGLTSNYNNTNEKYAITNSTVTVGTDSQSKLNYIQFNYTAPGPHTINSTVEIKTHNEYYNALTNTTTFKIVPSPMTINFTSITHNKTSNKITITADLKDYMNNTVSGINKYCVKINGITYYGNSTGGHIFTVENGKISITINSTTSNVRSIELVTGQRYAYSEARNTTTNIRVVS